MSTTTGVVTKYQCNECDQVYPSLEQAGKCHEGVGGVWDVVPVKGLVFEHAKRTQWDGSPKVFTVSSVQKGKVFYKGEHDYYSKPVRCSTDVFPKIVGKIVSLPVKKVSTEPTFTDDEVRALHAKGHEAGMAAGMAALPTPMHVVRRANPLDDTSPIVERYAPVMDGVCGFAWVWFAGNTRFGRASKRLGLARNAYPNGLDVWVSEFGQSLERKEAYARAYAEVLCEAGVTAFAQGRMD